jgi:hypothetical protein
VEGGCYRACNEALDCAAGKICDLAKHVCVQAPQCTSSAQCALAYGNVREECREGKCVLPCTGDTECQESVSPFLVTGPEALICSKKGLCEAIGCSRHDECGGSTRIFCVMPAPLTSAYHSAITD